MGDRLGIHDVVDLLLRLTFFLKKLLHSLDAPQTRKSLVKGERFIRSVWRAWVDALFWHLVVKEIWHWQESFDFWTFYICKPYQKQDDPQFRFKPLWHFDRYRFSAFWLRSKCSICSYQLNIWYGPHCGSRILNWFLNRGGALSACTAPSKGRPGIAVPPRLAHHPLGG